MNDVSEIVIERGIPIPKPRGRGRVRTPLRFALDKMEIGDSICVYNDGGGIKKTQQVAAGRAARLKPKKFVTRRLVENGLQIVRIWRVA
ncbi:MAG: hypothetical protein JSR91_00335 [Proteobacteria bacterium]|nr:hypothetical protein [Pseudomonadota bacterium]